MPASLEEIAYRQIRRQLLFGDLNPGQSLSEVTLANQIGVSRTPVRHALRQLEKDGLVVQVPRMGTFVKVPEPREIEEAFHTREVLETECAGLAAQRITDGQIVELRRYAALYRSAASEVRRNGPDAFRGKPGTDMIRVDLNLHGLIVRIAGNRMFARIIRDLRIQTRTRMHDLHERIPWERTKRKFARVAREHDEICDSICAHDAARARSAMRTHVRSAKLAYLEQIAMIGPTGEMPPLKPAVRMLLAQNERDAWVDDLGFDTSESKDPVWSSE